MSDALLLEIEVAEILRCSPEKVKRLRLRGALAYIPGRPVLVMRSDLDAYIERVKRGIETKQEEKELARKSGTRNEPNARKWAMQAVLLRRQKKP